MMGPGRRPGVTVSDLQLASEPVPLDLGLRVPFAPDPGTRAGPRYPILAGHWHPGLEHHDSDKSRCGIILPRRSPPLRHSLSSGGTQAGRGPG
jgi:hypothetical protein